MKHYRTTRHRAPALALVLVAAAGTVVGCGDGSTGASNGSSAADPSFPEGAFVRTVTSEDATALGIDEALAAEIVGPDGELDVRLTFANGEWDQSATYTPGTWETGDLGTYTVEDGLLKTVSTGSGSMGRVATFKWTFSNGTITLTALEVDGEPPLDQVERLMTEGSYESAD